MANIEITDQGGGGSTPLATGILQIANGLPLDATLRNVADQNNTNSPLKLSTTLVQTTSTLQITTNDNPYIDAEDGAGNNRFTIGRDPLSQQVNVDFASNPTGSTTTVGAIRTFQDGVNLSEVVRFREDGQVTFSERVNVEADSLVTTQTSSVIAATTTNASLVIAPNGTGALIADIPDTSVTGGNTRGNYATDLQRDRSLGTQVASGYASTIVGGSYNSAAGSFAVVGGYNNLSTGNAATIFGYENTAATYSAAVGILNNASGSSAFVAGRSNTASSDHSTVSGGQSNTASTGTHATVVGGQSNTSTGQGSISGGANCTATAGHAVSFGQFSQSSGTHTFTSGNSCIANADQSVSMGFANLSQARGSVSLGLRSFAYLLGQVSFASERFGTGNGDATQSYLTAIRQSTLATGATMVLSLDGTGATNLIIPNGQNRMWNVQVRWVAVVTAITGTATGVTVGDTKTSTDLLAVAKRAGTTTVSAHTSAGTHVIETIAGSLTAANIAYTAGASQQMAITFTGPTFAGGGSVTMRVVAAISLTEVAY